MVGICTNQSKGNNFMVKTINDLPTCSQFLSNQLIVAALWIHWKKGARRKPWSNLYQFSIMGFERYFGIQSSILHKLMTTLRIDEWHPLSTETPEKTKDKTRMTHNLEPQNCLWKQWKDYCHIKPTVSNSSVLKTAKRTKTRGRMSKSIT